MALRLAWIIFAILAIVIGLYPSIYFIVDREFGLLGLKPDALLQQTAYNVGFYLHIVPGGVAMLTGWTQFIAAIRNRRLAVHRTLGKIYVASALTGSLAGLYIAIYATGGWVSAVGFALLAILWFSTTLSAYLAIRKKDLVRHERMMTLSYALCFAAVTLRIWHPLLILITGEFVHSYRLVAWLCWVPNLVFGLWLIRARTRKMADLSRVNSPG